jgi:exopolyphosphatase/guanosine-5'-triphosphate,3'-diphosphate pyrophosphatase
LDGVIIPRWEWRTFAEDLEAEGARVLTHGEARLKESKEVYILSRRSNENTKIRDGLMDVKSLQAVNDDGLEQWRPIMKEEFPLTVETLIRLLGVLQVSAPTDLRSVYTYDEFLEDIVNSHPDLVAVDVSKRRQGLIINECITEFAMTEFNSIPLQTICVEHADPTLVTETVRQLGLDSFANINYIAAMKRAVGMD